ncbi:MAG TPA: cell wall hydrolase [Calditerricola sp.]
MPDISRPLDAAVPKPTRKPHPATEADRHVATLTLIGEARGEPDEGKIAVAWVIRNRAEMDLGNDGKPDWWGDTIYDVCLKPWQFSCWNEGDPNRKVLDTTSTSDPIYRACRAIVDAVLAGEYPDPTHGATHYCTLTLTPAWAKGRVPVAIIGRHKFFRDVG